VAVRGSGRGKRPRVVTERPPPGRQSRPLARGGQVVAADDETMVPQSARIEWGHVLARAVVLVESYDTGVTLRQLFYRLVSEQLIPNSQAAYKRLSSLSAAERRAGQFPDLIDRGRTIHRYETWTSPQEALEDVASYYRRDRSEGQDWSVYFGVEKAGIVEQLTAWFGDLGTPILALGGYASQSYVDRVVSDVEAAGRPAVLLYAGDFDPSGEDIDRDFEDRAGCWDKVVRVALDAGQVVEYALPPNPGKASDSRAQGFIDRHGELVQVELDALDPDDLHELYTDALGGYWDTSAYDAVLARESDERDVLNRLIGGAS
jgi:hypothetical protein